jgi:hypothetical protein
LNIEKVDIGSVTFQVGLMSFYTTGDFIMKPVIVIMLAASLAGCAGQAAYQARMAALDDGKCKGYGAQPGTPAYVQCRAQLDAARTQAIATIAAAPPPPVYTPPPLIVPPIVLSPPRY